METRTWNNVTIPSGEKTISFWFRSTSGDLTTTLITIDGKDIDLTFSGSVSTISFDGTGVGVGTDLNDGEWHFCILEIDASNGIVCHLNSVISSEASSTTVANSSDGSTGDVVLTVSANESIALFKMFGGRIELWDYDRNFIYDDVLLNSGKSFYEV